MSALARIGMRRIERSSVCTLINVALKNIHGFADLQFDLARPNGAYTGWTVFTGNNGSGKSSLPKAIGYRAALALLADILRHHDFR